MKTVEQQLAAAIALLRRFVDAVPTGAGGPHYDGALLSELQDQALTLIEVPLAYVGDRT